MNEAAEKREVREPASELELRRWSLVSFDACEASSLTYAEAAAMLVEKEAAGVYGLCIVTDEAARRMKP
jgi:hypothetical protein